MLPVVDLSAESACFVFFCGRCNTGDTGMKTPSTYVQHVPNHECYLPYTFTLLLKYVALVVVGRLTGDRQRAR